MLSSEKPFHFRRKSDRRRETSSPSQVSVANDASPAPPNLENDSETQPAASALTRPPAKQSTLAASQLHKTSSSSVSLEQNQGALPCERIPCDLPQEVRLLRLCERVVLLSLDDFRHRLVASLSVTGANASTESITDDELRCSVALYERAVSGFLTSLEQQFVTPNRLLASQMGAGQQSETNALLDLSSFVAVNALLEKRCRPNARNGRLAKSLDMLVELEARYDQEISSWEQLQSSLRSETLLSDDSWSASDLSPASPAEMEALRREISEQRQRWLEDLLLRLDSLERSMQHLHARYQSADQFCLETAQQMNAVAFDGFVDLGQVRKLLANGAQSVSIESL
jgi:hypothetical protein